MKKMQLLALAGLLAWMPQAMAQDKTANDDGVFKKRVLDNTEINWVVGIYGQNGENAAVTGGIGNEELKDFAQNIQVSIPVKDDNVMDLDITISGYTSASSSNLNPFDKDDKTTAGKAAIWQKINNTTGTTLTGSPWVASSGASRKDLWVNLKVGYSHYSDDRNQIYHASWGIANEFDYFSLGGSAAYTTLFNEKNTEFSIGTNIYLDHWRPQYPIELKTYLNNGGDLNADLFSGVDILDQNGQPTDKTGYDTWHPVTEGFIPFNQRNTYVLSLSFSQILTPNAQMALFTDITYQSGWLSNPMQRVYFADKPNYYIGDPEDIPIYTDPANTGVFQLADDYERLPYSRLKVPLGMRLHYYVNENLVVRTYYRYYFDDWGIRSHTVNVELPVKLSDKFTLYPGYRYYVQTAADYFAPYDTHLSTETYYTSDYDLSAFDAHQYGLGIKYTDIFTKMKIGKMGVKSFHLDFNHYKRSTGLTANIVSWHVNFVMD